MIVSSTAKIHGHYDFFTGLITLDKFTQKDMSLVKLALNKLPPPTNTPEAITLRDIRALVKHEITHFLDHSTTIWGIEFIFRRSRLIQFLMRPGANAQQAFEVYLINAAELQMHSELISIHKDITFDQCDIVKHKLVQNDIYGPIIIIKFFQGDILICDVPLSMLSLLEANAIANEYLSRFDDLAQMDQAQKSIAEAAVERKLKKILNEPDLAEYSVLINLAKIHFTFFDSLQLLSYISILVNYCLNVSISTLRVISENIRHSFENEYIGNGIWADLCRGMSRHVIAFKTILFMHAWIKLAPGEQRQNLMGIMANDPYNAIEMFWDEQRRSKAKGGEFEKSAALQILKKEKFKNDFGIASKVVEKNLKWRKQRNLRGCGFDEIACIDILLGDDSVVSYPQPIDFDVLEHSYQMIEPYSKFDELTKKSFAKFHMPLEEASAMLETILTQKDTMQSRMRQKSPNRRFVDPKVEEPSIVAFDVFRKAQEAAYVSTPVKATRRILFNHLNKSTHDRGFFHVDTMYGGGSGVLLKHEHTFYLLTADHVIANATDYAFRNESPFWMPSQANHFPQELSAFLMPAQILHIGEVVSNQAINFDQKDMILIELFFPDVNHMPNEFLDLDANPDYLATKEGFFEGQYLVAAGYPFDTNNFDWFDKPRTDGMTHSTQLNRLIVDGICEFDEGEPTMSRRSASSKFPNLAGAEGGIVTNVPAPGDSVKMLGMLVSAGPTIARFIPSYFITEALSNKHSARVTPVDPAFDGQPPLEFRKIFLDLAGHGKDADFVNPGTV